MRGGAQPVNPCLASARLAVNGAGLMGLVRGRQLISAAHTACWAAALQDYQEVCRWQRCHVCPFSGGKWSNVAGFLLGASLAAGRSLVGFTPRIKHFGFTFSFNTSSSIQSNMLCI